MSRPRRPGLRAPEARGSGTAFSATLAIHAIAIAAVFSSPTLVHRAVPPVYTVNLVAAPLTPPEARRAPEVVERPAERPAPVASRRRSTVAETPPPPERQAEREPAPRTTPEVELAPDAEPSTGSDPATVKTTGVEFPYPEYLRNIVAQVYRRWHRPEANVSLRAEVMFLVHRDGSVSGVRFIQRSGNFTFDLEAQGAIEAAANSLAFGPLPAGYGADVLPVNFFFDPSSAR
ncbi:MAG: TonB C-terminal domain-containing protein [Gemmatimonadota bacterium]|nr:MAG: TonB C-terminal domain-containing protein [Gemmatimonadota bacterium]